MELPMRTVSKPVGFARSVIVVCVLPPGLLLAGLPRTSQGAWLPSLLPSGRCSKFRPKRNHTRNISCSVADIIE